MEGSVSSLHNLIYNLNRLKVEESPSIRSIGDFELLMSGLEELNSMVEMGALKDSVVKQIKFLLVNSNRFQTGERIIESSAFDGHMLHTVIYGPPGVGKTEVCKILVKIWLGLGIIKQSTPIQQPDNNNNNQPSFQAVSEHINSLVIGNKIKEGIINRLQTLIADLKTDIRTVDSSFEDVHALLRKFKRKYPAKPIKTNSESNLYDHVNRRMQEPYEGLDIINKISEDIRRIQQALRKEVSKFSPDEKVKFGISIIDLNPTQDPSMKTLFPMLPPLSDELSDSNSPPTVPPPTVPPPTVPPPTVPPPTVPPPTVPPPTVPPPTVPPPTVPPPIIPQIPIISSSVEYTDEEKKLDLTNFVKIVSRDDFVAGYLGQSALKTEKLLRDSLGKVLFIDEAYSLVNDEKDSYGREAATVLNRFMSEHSQELIVIFAGYKDLMAETIFKYQPGLKSRCTWTFEIDGYTEKGLAEIFRSQVIGSGWLIESDIDLVKFFKKHIKDFQAYGRDTNRLVFYCKMCYAETIFNNNGIHNKLITKDILKKGVEYLKKNRIKDEFEPTISHYNMYI